MLLTSQDTPSIIVCVSADFSSRQVLMEIISGIEEESIPCRIVLSKAREATALAYQGAEESILEVGVGADGRGCIAVHCRGLPLTQPLFHFRGAQAPHLARNAGTNAARLVKGIPLVLEGLQEGATHS